MSNGAELTAKPSMVSAPCSFTSSAGPPELFAAIAGPCRSPQWHKTTTPAESPPITATLARYGKRLLWFVVLLGAVLRPGDDRPPRSAVTKRGHGETTLYAFGSLVSVLVRILTDWLTMINGGWIHERALLPPYGQHRHDHRSLDALLPAEHGGRQGPAGEGHQFGKVPVPSVFGDGFPVRSAFRSPARGPFGEVFGWAHSLNTKIKEAPCGGQGRPVNRVDSRIAETHERSAAIESWLAAT